MARTPLDPDDRKKLFNCYLSKESKQRLRTIAFRLSVHAGKRKSEGTFIEEKILSTKLPKNPSPAAVAEYAERYPDKRDEILAFYEEQRQ